jgi:predicted MFS family arabinose efflux permease
LPGILANPIKQDLALSDTSLGLINGFGFLVIYAAIGIPIARVADKGRYGVVIGTCVALWSLMTALGGFALSGWQLALTRAGVAVGEAGNTPASHAYISRNFPPDRRAAPLAILTLSSPIALLVGTLGGGLLGQYLGWRHTFMVMGLLGLLLAPVAYFALRGASRVQAGLTEQKASISQVAALLKKRSYIVLLAATAFIGMAGYGINAFGPAYLMRSHSMSVGEVAVQYGPLQGLIGATGLLLASFFADRLVSRDVRWPLWVVSLMITLLVPFTLIGFFAQNKWIAMIGLALGSTMTVAYQAPVVASMLRLVPINMRATSSAILLFSTAMFGGLGPLLIGLISDRLTPGFGEMALAHAMLIVGPILVVAALLFFVVSLSFETEIVSENLTSSVGEITE